MAWNADGVKDYLTPKDVESKTFTPVRRREGYDMAEVDQFLDEVSASLKTLISRNEDLARSGPPTPVAAPAPVATPAPAPAAPAQQKPMSPTEATTAAVRVLQLAEEEADRARADAEAKAAKRLQEAEDEARGVEGESRARMQALDRELAARREEALSALDAERRALADEVESLRSFEQDYRGRLRSYLETQLERLFEEGHSETAQANGSRLSALLDSDDSAV